MAEFELSGPGTSLYDNEVKAMYEAYMQQQQQGGYQGSDWGGNDGGSWIHRGVGGGVGGDGETFYFIDGDSSYISGN